MLLANAPAKCWTIVHHVYVKAPRHVIAEVHRLVAHVRHLVKARRLHPRRTRRHFQHIKSRKSLHTRHLVRPARRLSRTVIQTVCRLAPAAIVGTGLIGVRPAPHKIIAPQTRLHVAPITGPWPSPIVQAVPWAAMSNASGAVAHDPIPPILTAAGPLPLQPEPGIGPPQASVPGVNQDVDEAPSAAILVLALIGLCIVRTCSTGRPREAPAALRWLLRQWQVRARRAAGETRDSSVESRHPPLIAASFRP